MHLIDTTRKCRHSLLGDSDGIDDCWSEDDGRWPHYESGGRVFQ